MGENLMILAIVAIPVVIGVLVGVSTVKKSRQLLQSGKTVARQPSFWEYAEYFLTDVSYEALRRVLLETDLQDCGVSVTPDLNGRAEILFRCRHGWNAVIRWQGSREEKNAFMIYFPAWRSSRYGTPYGFNQMNMLLTRVEQLFLAMDPDTAVQNRRMQTKTKRSFI